MQLKQILDDLLAGAPGAMARSPARGATKVLDFQTAADDTCEQVLG
jgi:hypothetical protein